MEIRYDDSEATEAVEGVEQRISDTARALAALATLATEVTAEAIATASTPEGQPWAPRKQTTRHAGGEPERPRSRQNRGPLLRLTGRMLSRVSTRIERGRVILAIRSPTYTLHAGGTTTRNGQPRMPARRILPTHEAGASKAALDAVVEQFADYAIGTRGTIAGGRRGR